MPARLVQVVGYLSLFALAGCGITETSKKNPAVHPGDAASSGTGGGGKPRGSGGHGTFCSSLEARDPESVVVVGRDGASLGFLRASGRITVTEPLIEGRLPILSVSPNRAYAVIYSLEFVDDGMDLELALYEFDRGLLWRQRLTGSGLLPPAVGDDGRVTLRAGGDELTIDLEGEIAAAPAVRTPGSTPDAQGWVLTEFDSPAGETAPVRGFENVETGEVRYLTHANLGSGQFPVRVDNAYYYFTDIDGELVLVRETSHAVELIETSQRTSAEPRFVNDGDWFWVYVSGAPVWRYSAGEALSQAIPWLEPASDERFATHLSAGFVLVTERGGPRYTIDLSTLELVEHSTLGAFDTWQVSTAGPWFLGSGQNGPHWRVHAQDGSSERIDLSDVLAGRTDWPVTSCSDEPQSRALSVLLFDDGSFGMALRDDTQAAYFLGSFDFSEWTPLGGFFADVQEIHAWQHGPTWLVAGSSTASDFCPLVGDSPFLPAAEPDMLIRGNAFQIVPPNRDHIVVLDGHPYPAHFHQSGLCVARDDHLYDLARGTSIELGFRAEHWFVPNDE